MSHSVNSITKHDSKETTVRIIFAVALGLFFVVCTELYRRMTISYPGFLGTYYSDINVRLAMSENGQTYSIFLMPEYFFANHLDKNLGALCIGIYLSVFTIGTLLLVYRFLKVLCPQTETWLLAVFSFVCMLAMPIVIFTFSERIYGPYVGTVWHNESYLGMRFVAILILIFFYRTHDRYLKSFSVKEFFIACLLFLLVNWIKPNFIIAFAPAMLVMMIVDIIKAKGKGFFKWVMYGVPVLVGALILPFQYLLLFPGSDDSGSSVVFIMGDFFLSQKTPVINLLLALAFPILIFIIHRKEFLKSKFHLVCCLGWVFAFLEYVFLAETGIRRGHENFYWGVRLFTFIIYCLSVGFFISDIRNYLVKKKELKNKESTD